LCNLVNPERIVVGGALTAAGEMLLGPLRSAIERHAVPSAARDMTVVQGELGSRTETLGALALVIAESDRLVTHGARPTAQDPTIPAGVPS
jgi:predicted NBD/HSP70 family sugar kinase